MLLGPVAVHCVRLGRQGALVAVQAVCCDIAGSQGKGGEGVHIEGASALHEILQDAGF